MEKNGEYIGTVERLGINGEGIIVNNGKIVFIPYTLPEEVIRYKVIKVQKDYAYAKVIEIIKQSSDRVLPECAVFGKCGGCQLQHAEYLKQLDFKKHLVENNFKKIASLTVEVNKVFPSANKYRYRNKLQLPVSFDNNETVIGFYANNSHRVIETDDCIINGPWVEDIITVFKSFIKKYNIVGYNENTGKGLLRHIVVREVNGKLIITAVVNSQKFSFTDKLINELNVKFSDYSLYINYNDSDTNIILGERFLHVFGPRYVQYEFDGIIAEMDARSFMQVNTCVSEEIYRNVVEYIDETDVVIDAYSGAGLMTGIIAKKAKSVYGVEIIEEAVKCADKLKENNGLFGKMNNICGDCKNVLPDLISKVKPTVIVLDPPRKGCEYHILKSILNSEIKKVIYVSCNPATLARDVGILCGTLVYDGNLLVKSKTHSNKYNLQNANIYDIFAQTKHVETLAVLNRVN